MNTKHCLTCGDPDTHFERKYCSIDCADIYDGIEAPTQQTRIDNK